ncbi:MAG: sensor histidine kinase [Lachnospiraceae bacterium]|nr:sensor histidine kinase [Lachnospiraceae bacterium]
MRSEKQGRRKKLQWQMMGAVMMIALVISVLFIIVFQSMRKVITRQYSDAAQQSVSVVAENIDYILQELENQTNSILLNQELIASFRSGKKEEFCSQLNSYFLSGIYMEGIYIVSDQRYWYVGSDISEDQNKIRIQPLEETSGEIVWLPTRTMEIRILSGLIPKACFSLGRKIVDVHSLQELGYMVVELNEDILNETCLTLTEDGSDVLIVDREQNVISSSESSVSSALAEDSLHLDAILRQKGAGSYTYQENGKSFVSLYAPLNKGNWTVIKTIPQSVLYGEVERLQRGIVTGSLILLVLLLAGTWLYFKRITDPIKKIIGQMKKVEEGNLQVQVDTDVQNEFGNLGESFNHMIVRVRELMETVVAAERSKKELELEVLHAQINPHFLYNTLSTIRFMAKIKGEESISSAIVALTKLLRISISFGKEMIQLKEEICYVDNYMLIQRLRFNQRFHYEYNLLPEHEKILVPKLILQPIVENALIYGMEESSEDQEKVLNIKIYTENVENGVEVVAQDNGPGMTKERIQEIFREEKDINKFSKVGLNNVNQRIKLYCGESYGILIDSEPGRGTRIIIRLPAAQDSEK